MKEAWETHQQKAFAWISHARFLSLYAEASAGKKRYYAAVESPANALVMPCEASGAPSSRTAVMPK